MKSAQFGVAVLVCGFLLGGCDPAGVETYERYELGEACRTVVLGVESTGGLGAWKKIREIRADALLTFYDDSGRVYVNRQKQRIDIHGDKITAEATTARGRWRAKYRGGGRFSLRGAGALDQIGVGQICEALAIVLHRVRGPLNLLRNSEKPSGIERIFLDSRDLVRVSVTGGDSGVNAYYFDATSGLLQMVATGPQSPAPRGTVTLYTYQMLPKGIVFPKKIRVVRTGRHVLVGKTPVMEVEFSDVVIR